MTETVAGRIARALAERIITGELAAGAPLRQDHVAREFDASHVPAREALQMLRVQGLAIHQVRRGMRVAPLDPVSIQETIDIRAALETLALKLAAPRMNAVHLEKIEQALAAGDQAKTIVEWEQANREFHRALVAPCKMPKLLSMLDDLQLANSRIIFSAAHAAGWQPGSSHTHRQIVAALRKRDTARAIAILEAHIRGLEHAANDRFGAAPPDKAATGD